CHRQVDRSVNCLSVGQWPGVGAASRAALLDLCRSARGTYPRPLTTKEDCTMRRALVLAAVLGGLGELGWADEKGDKGKKHPPNRLAHENSPYLLQHAHNPVDWYPWGPEAFAKAKKEKKLVFLSIGYSSCYWCHVMERQSFANEEVAKLLN